MVLAVDIGGTAVKMALIDKEGHIGSRYQASTNFDQYKTPMLETVIREAGNFLRQENARIEGIGVSATGFIDTRTGSVIGANGIILNYEGSQIKAEMEKAFSVPVFVLNDADAAALGEVYAGRAKGYRYVLMVTIGTGVGGGIIIDGKIYGGVRGIGGEIGQFVLRPGCTGLTGDPHGWYEGFTSTTALVRAAEAATGESGLNGRIIFERAANGDKIMLDVLDKWEDDIVYGLEGLVYILNPELILIGGGVCTQEKLLIEPLRKKLTARLVPCFSENLEIQAAALGNDAGLIGAYKFYLDNK